MSSPELGFSSLKVSALNIGAVAAAPPPKRSSARALSAAPRVENRGSEGSSSATHDTLQPTPPQSLAELMLASGCTRRTASGMWPAKPFSTGVMPRVSIMPATAWPRARCASTASKGRGPPKPLIFAMRFQGRWEWPVQYACISSGRTPMAVYTSSSTASTPMGSSGALMPHSAMRSTSSCQSAAV